MSSEPSAPVIPPETHGLSGPARLSFRNRLLRAGLMFAFLLLLVWWFGHAGVLHKLETVVSDMEMRLNPAPADSAVVLVDIDDDDYRTYFGASSPLNPVALQKLIAAIAKGGPSVIGVDIDTSAKRFASEFQFEDWKPQLVWEREVREIPVEANQSAVLEPMDILGGKKDIDPSKNSSGLALLLDDPEDKVTRRYRRLIMTRAGALPSFPWAIAKAYLRDHPSQLAALPQNSDDLVIRYSGGREGANRFHFSARKLEELAERWPEASPIQGKIVLLGGSYLGEDRHDTPVGQLTGLEVMANVVETELSGGGYKAPSHAMLFLLELFEALGLVLLFHNLKFRYALLFSILLIPAMASLCSEFAYGNLRHFGEFALVLTGLLVFELYEHFRRAAVPRIYHDVAGGSAH